MRVHGRDSDTKFGVRQFYADRTASIFVTAFLWNFREKKLVLYLSILSSLFLEIAFDWCWAYVLA